MTPRSDRITRHVTEPASTASAEAVLSVGKLALMSQTPATTLRYYERRGLIDPPARVGGQRRYEPTVLQRLMVIKFCRIAGLSLDEVERVVLDRTPGRTTMKDLAARQLRVIDEQLRELELARRMMESVIDCRCIEVEACTCGAMEAVITELRDRLG